jgi:hypothetical protein
MRATSWLALQLQLYLRSKGEQAGVLGSNTL